MQPWPQWHCVLPVHFCRNSTAHWPQCIAASPCHGIVTEAVILLSLHPFMKGLMTSQINLFRGIKVSGCLMVKDKMNWKSKGREFLTYRDMRLKVHFTCQSNVWWWIPYEANGVTAQIPKRMRVEQEVSDTARAYTIKRFESSRADLKSIFHYIDIQCR